MGINGNDIPLIPTSDGVVGKCEKKHISPPGGQLTGTSGRGRIKRIETPLHPGNIGGNYLQLNFDPK